MTATHGVPTRGVVVVAYGTPDLVAAALASVAGEVVVVVDNSRRADVAAVAAAAGAHLVTPGTNLGFAGGVNRGVAALRDLGVEGDVLLLNPDARLAAGDLETLQATLHAPGHHDVAAVAPALLDPDGRPQRVSWPFPSPARMWVEAFGLARLLPTRARFAVGAVLLLRAAALADVGGFDERFFLYAEEADWQCRAWNRGWRTVVVDDVAATHVGAATATDPGRREALFHAGQELYVRRWSGPLGWAAYRSAVVVGAAGRAVVGAPPARAAARDRLRRYLRGPVRVADLPVRRPPLRVTHVVVTDGAAGVEHHVAAVAARQHGRGHDVAVVGGDGALLRPALPPGVAWSPGATVAQAVRALRRGGPRDVVHAHLTAADLVAVATRPWHGGLVVSTRHIACRRGATRAARWVSALVERGIGLDVFVSDFVRAAAGRPGVVVHNGVVTDDRSPEPAARTLVVAQRLEREKATDVAVRAFVASGLAAHGWDLVVCGAGAQLAPLQQLARELGAANVTWRGWVPDVRAVLLESAALLATAPAEPFGLSVVEAMSLGVPVVAAAGGGHLETLGGPGDGLLFTPGDVEDCTRALLALAAKTAPARRAHGERLRSRQRAAFDLDTQAAALEDLYHRPVAAPPGARTGFDWARASARPTLM